MRISPGLGDPVQLFDDDRYVLDRRRLPDLVPPLAARTGRRSVRSLVLSAIVWGLASGAVTGAATAAALFIPAGISFALVAIVLGAWAGLLVSLPLTLLLTGVIAGLAAARHAPLRDPAKLHREIWLTFITAVALLDAPVVALLASSRSVGAQAIGLPVAGFATIVLVLMLRRAARRIVVAHAKASGWRVRRSDTMEP